MINEPIEILAHYIRRHGIEAEVQEGELFAVDHYSLDGEARAEWVRVEATTDAVRVWLGY